MKLHENQTEFRELITLTAQEKHIPESAAGSIMFCFSVLILVVPLERSDTPE